MKKTNRTVSFRLNVRVMSFVLTLISVIGLITAAFPLSASAASLSDSNGNSYQEIIDLNVTTAIQNKNWSCSGAATKSVLDYFGISHGKTAENLYVSYLYQLVNNLNAYGLNYKYKVIYDRTTWENTVTESLMKGNPVPLLVGIKDKTYWNYTTGGHYIVISGLYRNASGVLYFLCNESWAYALSGNTAYYNRSTNKVLVPASVLYSYSQSRNGYVIYSDTVRDTDRYNRAKSLLTYLQNCAAVNKIYVTKSQITVRNQPAAVGTAGFTYKKGEQIVVLSSGYNHYGSDHIWYYVTDNYGHTGYIYCTYAGQINLAKPTIKSITKYSCHRIKVTMNRVCSGNYTVKATNSSGRTVYSTFYGSSAMITLPSAGTWYITVRDTATVYGVTQNGTWSGQVKVTVK